MRGRAICVLLGVALLALALPWPAEGAFPGRNGKLAFAFYSLPQRNMDIWTLDPDGQSYTRLTTAPEADRKPAWSANGRWIAFERAGNIWLMRADGTDARLVADPASPATSPGWSPDGRRIVFAFCRAEREFLGEEFVAQYRNFGGCVSAKGYL